MSIDLFKVANTSYTTSLEAYDVSRKLLEKLGFSHWYQVARLAIARSMAEQDFPHPAPNAKSTGIRGHQLFGNEEQFDLLWISLIAQNWMETHATNEITAEEFQGTVRSHWHRGAHLLEEDWKKSGEDYTKFIDILITRWATLDDSGQRENTENSEESLQDIESPKDKSNDLQKILHQLQVLVEIKGVEHGPRLSTYRIYLPNINHLSKIENKTDEIRLALGVKTVSVEPSEIPQTIFLQISRESSSWKNVAGSNIIDWIAQQTNQYSLPLCIGVDVENKPYSFDLALAPHLMVAGTTNSGKSVTLHAIIISLLYKCGIHNVKFLMIDPKRVELSLYDLLPNLIAEKIITEVNEANDVLVDILTEIDQRNRQLQTQNFQNIKEAREAGCDLPYIVVVIEELADLIMQTKSAENNIVRIAQIGRSAGVHLVLSTQRPDAKTFSGLLRSNTARIALSVQKASDSRIILDEVGAEKLLGAGDMLVRPQAGATAIRLHGVSITKSDVTACINYVTQQ